MKDKLLKFLFRTNLYNSLKIFKEKIWINKLEQELIKKRRKFYSQFVNSGDLCFDVGANYGNRTEAFLSLGARVVAVEPQDQPASFLEKKFNGRISVEKCALGAVVDEMEMHVSYNHALSSLSHEWISEVKKNRFNKVGWQKKVRVEVNTLDNLIKKHGKPDFCKIDVEGYEKELLMGLTAPIKMLSFEYTIPEFTEKAVDCITYLRRLGDIECNYSVGETLKLGLEKWMTSDEFINHFRTLPGKGIIDGDVYIRFR